MPFFRKINFISSFFFSILFVVSCKDSNNTGKKEIAPENPYSFVHYPEQKYTNMYFGEITPNGWIDVRKVKASII